MKTIIAVLISSIFFQYMAGQSFYSKLYDYQNTKEFDSELLMLNNGNVLAIGGLQIKPENYSPRGILLREVNPENGALVSENFIGRDSLSLHISGLKHCHLLNDSTIIITGTAQYKEEGYYSYGTPFFLKYDFKNNKELNFKLFEVNIGGEFISSLLHIDNHVYCVGFQFRNRTDRKDKLVIKIDLEGNLVWKKVFDQAERESFTEAESFGNNLIICGGNTVFGEVEQEQHIAKFDTSGVILNETTSHLSGIFGISQTEISDSAIFYTATAKVGDSHSNDTQYLIRYDSDLKIVWDTLIPITNTFDIRLRSFKIADNQLITMSAITDAEIFTKNKVWNYASSWSFDGQLNWEHAYFYDSTYTHHLDDVLLNDDKMLFLGTVFSYTNFDYNQRLWLYNTDKMGCSPVLEDSCLYSLDDYFPRPPCTANAGLDWASCDSGSGKEYLGAFEVVKGGEEPYTYHWHTDHPAFNSKYYLEDVNVAKPKLIPYMDWKVPYDSAVNFILTVTDAVGTTCTDTVRYLGYFEGTDWYSIYPEPEYSCIIQPGDSCKLNSEFFPSTDTGIFDWLALGLHEYNPSSPGTTCCPYVTSESPVSFITYITDGNGCVNKTKSKGIVSDIDEFTNLQVFNLYPNPVSKKELLYLDFADKLTATSFNLYNSAGKLVSSKNINRNTNSLHLKELTVGLYYFQFSSDQQILHTGKLIVKP